MPSDEVKVLIFCLRWTLNHFAQLEADERRGRDIERELPSLHRTLAIARKLNKALTQKYFPGELLPPEEEQNEMASADEGEITPAEADTPI